MLEYDFLDLVSKAYEKNQSTLLLFKQKDFLKEKSIYNLEEKVINPITPNLQNKICFAGVDSGFINKQLGYLNLTIIKEGGAVFSYENQKLSNVKYFPKAYTQARPYLTTSSLELEEIVWNTSILRIDKEIRLAKNILKQTLNLNFLLLDGSLVPQYLNKPSKDSKLYASYVSLIENILSLFQECKQKKVFLVGCVEDSRADRFCRILSEFYLNEKIQGVYDSFLVDFLLLKNQRTCVFKYTDKMQEHVVLKDFPKEIVDNLYVCYLKLSEHDLPLRIEFVFFEEFGLSLKDFTEFLVSNLSYISSFNRRYIFPSPLIEADLQSRLKFSEIDLIVKNVLERTKKYGLRLQRRESRLF